MDTTKIDFNKFTTDPDKGLFYGDECLCDYIEVVALVRNSKNSKWKSRIRFKDMLGDFCVLDIPKGYLFSATHVARALLKYGFNPEFLELDKKLIMYYLRRACPGLKLIDDHNGIYRVPNIRSITIMEN